MVLTMLRFTARGFLALMPAVIALPVLAQTANFDSLTLAPGFKSSQAVVSGNTGGSFSLPSIVLALKKESSDRYKKPCIGFGSQKPDHIIQLQQDFPKLRIKVNSGGKDTTLIIKGPEDVIRCGDDTGSRKDASVEDTNWKSGKYLVWVGSIETGQKWNYQVSVEQP
jgi:hypothetical protein